MSATAAPVVSASIGVPMVGNVVTAEPSGVGAGIVQHLPAMQSAQYVQQPYAPLSQPVLYVDEAGNPVDINQMQQPMQYVDEQGNPVDINQLQQPVQYVDEQGYPVDINHLQQPVQYVDEQGYPVDMNLLQQPVQYVDEQGYPVQMNQAVQYVDEFGNPVHLDNEQGTLGTVYGAPPVQQPVLFNVSPETFAKLAQGGTLTEEEVDALTGVSPAQAAPDAVATAPPAEAALAVASSIVGKNKSSKSSTKKALSSKSLKKKVCC